MGDIVGTHVGMLEWQHVGAWQTGVRGMNGNRALEIVCK